MKRTRSVARLAPEAAWFYTVKAAATRARSAAWLVRTRGRVAPGGVRILFYHRVTDDRDELAVRPSRFRGQMQQLREDGYRATDVCEVARLLAAGALQEKIVGLSFDDGYRDVAENALPVLAEQGFRATVFVATAVADGRALFDWYERQPPVLGWDEIEALDADGTLRFEAHTVTHPNLLMLGETAAEREIVDSKAILEQHLGRPVEAFCYPGGLAGARERALVEQAGFKVAASCEPGVNTATTDPLMLRRRQIDRHDGMLDFRAKVGGGHDAPLPLRRAYRRARYGAAGTPRSASART